MNLSRTAASASDETTHKRATDVRTVHWRASMAEEVNSWKSHGRVFEMGAGRVRQLRRALNCYLQLHALLEIALTRWRIHFENAKFP